MTQYQYDVLVIGSGPAGESASMNAIKHDLKTAIIEQQAEVGGGCTHQGTIPSKALRQAVKQFMRDKKNPFFSFKRNAEILRYPQILETAKGVIKTQVDMRSKYYGRNRIDFYSGTAKFIAEHELEVADTEGNIQRISAKQIIIATGSRPYRPDDVDFDHPRVYDSDTILEMSHSPRKIIIYGAGVIGCEYASIFSGLGVKVELLNTRDRLLEFLDEEISDALSYHLRTSGVMIRHREEYSAVVGSDHGVELQLKSGKKLKADALLWCNGRSGNTGDLNLSAVGLSANHRGQLEIDNNYKTASDYIYAAGDVIGWPSLASAAYNQGRAASAAARGKEAILYVDDVPTGIYTIPEISSVGKNELELTQDCVPYEIGRAFFKEVGRAQISGEDVGMLKILFHPDSLEILGIHCFGAEACEIIHIGQAIMNQEGGANTLRYFVNTTFNYPTMAEAYRIAALNGLNRLSY